MSQLALPLQLADHAVFDSFWPAGNEATVAYLEDLAAGDVAGGGWLWGPPASGRSHLLQAVCERVGPAAAYLPLGLLAEAGPGVLEGMAEGRVVCLDDATHAAGDRPWEHALFDLFNRVHDRQGLLLVAAGAPPREAGFRLPDLASRFAQLPAFQLRPLAGDELVRALQLRSRHRGLELPSETAGFLLNRARRDMGSLYALLDRLDAEALRAQRRLTVPFVREVLGRDAGSG